MHTNLIPSPCWYEQDSAEAEQLLQGLGPRILQFRLGFPTWFRLEGVDYIAI